MLQNLRWKINFPFNLIVIFIVFSEYLVSALYQFPALHIKIPKEDRDFLNQLTSSDLRHFIELGTESFAKELSLEENLISSNITVQNGSLSHNQLLETLPCDKTKVDSEVAMKILRSSVYIYNSKCIEHGVNGDSCRAYLSEKPLPQNTLLWAECNKVLQNHQNGHHVFRRILPSKYQDGFYKMFAEDKLPAARMVSSNALHGLSTNVQLGNEALDESHRNLALVQWAQFIEHDLSKPVVTSMKSGESIDCCNNENYKLQPRFLHPACAPLMSENRLHKHGRETCLNYVRSALAVSSDCNFGGAEQLNQATAYLDLSQLYGYDSISQQSMRNYHKGQLKSSHSSRSSSEDMLPLTAAKSHAYCALKLDARNESCFMAGDSRVNSNPFSIVLYTIFMRSHNRIAHQLSREHPDWNDDRLYNMSKAINIDLYRRIIFKEWLPAVVGQELANQINSETLSRGTKISIFKISNEFAVAAIRFYYSMMPNELIDLTERQQDEINAPIEQNNILPSANIFELHDQRHRSKMVSNSIELNNVLESLLHQRAMKMDAQYAESFTESYMGASHPTRADVLAFDIQRGRDHGLQGYVKYLELCQGIIVRDWADLNRFIDNKDIDNLRSVYANWNDVDLIVGAISEKPVNGSTVGPTFTCILGEQFSKIHQWHQLLDIQSKLELANDWPYRNWTGAELLCANSKVKKVPQNIFKIGSETNPMIFCATILRAQGL